MSKKAKTIIFIIGATVFNIIVTVLCFLALLALYSRYLYFRIPEDSLAWALPVIFLASILASFLVYRLALKLIMKKVDLNTYLEPVFSRYQPRKP
jgi:hypothetical protein